MRTCLCGSPAAKLCRTLAYFCPWRQCLLRRRPGPATRGERGSARGSGYRPQLPTYLTAPSGDPRLFIVEKTGAIRIVKDALLLPNPFLDLGSRISNGGEQGLLGLAFDPDYATTRRFIVHYTDVAGNTVVSQFVASDDPDHAELGSEQIILTQTQPFSNHNGGQIVFGPDGFLYLGLGDGGRERRPG